MNQNQRLTDIILATRLGPMFLLWGIIEKNGQLQCECRKGLKCSRAGKHARCGVGWNKPGLPLSPTSNIGLIQMWFREFPSANWAVLMGERVFVLDCDIRPGKKNGVEALRKLLGREPEEAIKIRSGSGIHYYFQLPDQPEQMSAGGPHFLGVDLKKLGSGRCARVTTHQWCLLRLHSR